MSTLPYEPSDSEDEYVVGLEPVMSPLQSSPEDSDVTKTTTTPHTAKINYFQPPSVERKNPDTTIPAHVKLVLATDLSTASYLDYISSLCNAIEVINIKALIQTDEDKKKKKENKPTSTTTTTTTTTPTSKQQLQQQSQKYINYSIRLIPGTNTLIGLGDLEISAKYANFIAKAIFPSKSDEKGHQFITKIDSIFCLNALSIATLSAHNQLFYSSEQQYPFFYQITNYTRPGIVNTGKDSTPSSPENTITNPVTSLPPVQFSTDPKTSLPIPLLPQTIGLGGLTAAVMTWATLYGVPSCAGVSIRHQAFQTELFVSLDKMCKLFQIQNGQNAKVPSMYGLDVGQDPTAKVSIGMRNQAVKAILALVDKKLAYNERMLPRGKQGGSAPITAMFF